MQLAQARENMLKQQIRTFGVFDAQILTLLMEMHREKFVPENFTQLAYADVAIPLGRDQAMLTPKETALLLQALKIKKNESVLVVGVESGYTVALLAKLAKHVTVVDADQVLLEQAKNKLASLAINNVTFEKGNGAGGWEKGGPYKAIVITGSLPYLPQGFHKNLAREGRIFAIIGNPPVMEATILQRTSSQWVTEKIFETHHPRLPNAIEPEKFVF